MGILNRSWKKNKNYNLFSIENINGEINIVILNANYSDELKVFAKVRGDEEQIIVLSVNKEGTNSKFIRCILNCDSLSGEVGKIWDIYIKACDNAVHRVKSKIIHEKAAILARNSKGENFECYSTINGNLSIKVVTDITRLNTASIKIEKEKINITGELISAESNVSLSLSGSDAIIKESYEVTSTESINGYYKFYFVYSCKMTELLSYYYTTKFNSLAMNICINEQVIDTSEIVVPESFRNITIALKNETILFEKDKSSKLKIKVHDKKVRCQVKTVIAKDSKFTINGFIENYNDDITVADHVFLRRREEDTIIKLDLKWLDTNNFETVIDLVKLSKINIKFGIWDFIFNIGEKEYNIENTWDDIEEKRSIINIPQQMFSNEINTSVYKIYYTKFNEISLIVRDYMKIKRVISTNIKSDEIRLEGEFWVEPPKQTLPKEVKGRLTINGFYGKIYEFDCDVSINQTEKRYYSKFKICFNINNFNEDDKENLRKGLFYNLVKLEMKIDEFNISINSKINRNSLVKKESLFNKVLTGNKLNSAKNIYKLMNKVVPINRSFIVYQTFNGKSYSCNPKWIYEYIRNEKKGYKGIWVLENEEIIVPEGTIIVRPNTLKYFYYLARSKYFINNGNFPDFFEKRKNTIHIQTWHGTPLKKIGADIAPNSPAYKENNSEAFWKRTKRWDYLISPNEYCSVNLKRAFKFENKMMNTGYPRNDVLYSENKDLLIKDIKNKIGINQEKKVILYAPTWRDNDLHGDAANGCYDIKFSIEKFKEKFGDTHILLLRLHHRDAEKLNIDIIDKTVVNVSFYDDIQELYLISDLLITDYSSVMFDFANLKRNMIFYCYDYLKYKGSMRGCYFDFTTVAPGPIVFEEEQLFAAIENSQSLSEAYKVKLDSFNKTFCEWEDGRAAERVTSIFLND